MRKKIGYMIQQRQIKHKNTQNDTKTSANETQIELGHPIKIEAIIEDDDKKQRHHSSLNPHYKRLFNQIPTIHHYSSKALTKQLLGSTPDQNTNKNKLLIPTGADLRI